MIALKNCTVVQFQPPQVVPGTDVLIDGTTVRAVGKGAANSAGPDSRPDTTLDCTGKIVMPGLVCSHNHFYSGLARGITANLGPITDFVTTLQHLWWKMDRALDPEILAACGTISCLEAIKSGTTAVIDHHASQSFIKGSLSILKESFEKTGLRGITCFEVSNRAGLDAMKDGVEENIDFAEKTTRRMKENPESTLVSAMIGGHAPFTLPDEGLRLLAGAVEKTGKGLHLHVAEDRFDRSYSHARYGQELLVRLDDFGLLTNKAVIVHGLFLSEKDIELLNSRDAYLVHNARSNMNNGVGYMEKLKDVRNAALGTDGIGSDMFEEFKFAFFKHADTGGGLGPDDFLHFLFNGNDLLERNFPGTFGRIEAGCKADLVVLDYHSPTPLLPENIAGHICFGMKSSDVETVIINGNFVYENRQFPFDTAPLYSEARKSAQTLWDRMNSEKQE